MTCIVGIAERGKVWIGGDSAGVSEYNLTVRRDKKVTINGPYIIGFTSSFRMGDILKWCFKPPKPPKKEEQLEKFMADQFIDSISKCFAYKGYETTDNGKKEAGQFLVGVHGVLFNIFNDYQVGRNVVNYESCGCGSQVALGSMFTSSSNLTSKSDPESRITMALDAATAFSAGVRGPYHIMYK